MLRLGAPIKDCVWVHRCVSVVIAGAFLLLVLSSAIFIATTRTQAQQKTSTTQTPIERTSPDASKPAPAQTPNSVQSQTDSNIDSLTLDEALKLANTQASIYQQAKINEDIAAEDVKQARAAFLPKVSAPLSYLYTSPLLGAPPGTPREPSFIANNAVNEYEALVNVSGDFDIAGRLRATLRKNQALLAAAHAGSEVARNALHQAVVESYFGLALATAQRRSAEQNLAASEEFERITTLLLQGGEVASVDVTRAQLQTTSRRDELEKARAAEIVSAGALRVLIGYDFTKPIGTLDLSIALPVDADLQHYSADMVSRRPEFAQLDAQREAAKQEKRAAHAERLPSLTYSVNGGFDTDSVKGPQLKEHTGVSAGISLNIPIFDSGAAKSRERQAHLREDLAESQRILALRGFTQQFYDAQANAIAAAARVRLAEIGIRQAQINLDASIARYRGGEAQIIEVTDAQTTLVAQRSAFHQAIFDYQTSLQRLKQATGQ
ncbi:MAG TPA: TolC family protein [Pyrinomonadaceae bacterium]|nr:TolC family protein [Pyrinomonadaceae bacterium]